jgi:phospholipase C
VLRTIHDRWGTTRLTQRDKNAASLADAIMLSTPRQDDPLKGVGIPVSTGHHPNSSVPSKIDKIHAARVAALPLRNEKGHYEEATFDLSSSAPVSNFIRETRS